MSVRKLGLVLAAAFAALLIVPVAAGAQTTPAGIPTTSFAHVPISGTSGNGKTFTGHFAVTQFVNRAAERNLVQRFVSRLNIRTPSHEQRVGLLSGGNQQKVMIAKWLAVQPKCLIVDEPTRGVDVGTKAEIYALFDELAHAGVRPGVRDDAGLRSPAARAHPPGARAAAAVAKRGLRGGGRAPAHHR